MREQNRRLLVLFKAYINQYPQISEGKKSIVPKISNFIYIYQSKISEFADKKVIGLREPTVFFMCAWSGSKN